MNNFPQKQLSCNSITDLQAALVDTTYWLVTVADQTDLLHHDNTWILEWSGDSWPIKLQPGFLCFFF